MDESATAAAVQMQNKLSCRERLRYFQTVNIVLLVSGAPAVGLPVVLRMFYRFSCLFDLVADCNSDSILALALSLS